MCTGAGSARSIMSATDQGEKGVSNSVKKILQMQNNPDLLLLPKINEYLLEHGDKKFSQTAMETVWEPLTTPPRVRSASFSSSSAGVDLRHQELAFLGYPQKPIMPNLQIIFTIGHWLHAMTQGLLLSANLIQDIEVSAAMPEYYAKGSMDGQGNVWWPTANPAWQDQEFILEAKTVGSHMWEKKVKLGRPADDHLAQIHRYFLATGIRLCSYLLIDKGSWGSDGMVEFVVEADDKLLEASRRELEELKNAVDTKTLHAPSLKCQMGLKNNCPFGGKNGWCGTVHEWQPYQAA
jgi:hypothetical protein